MRLRQVIKRTTAFSLIALAAVGAYEAFAVWRAETRTHEILAAYKAKPQPVSLSQLTPRQKAILLSVEDPGFYQHNGVDFASPGQGMTTITQALVKFLYFERFRAGFAKIEQSLIARYVLNRHLPKDEQLALFINHAYLGERDGKVVRGFATAAEAYFGKPFAHLSEEEYVGLVGMLISPDALRPDKHPDAYAERLARIRSLLDGKCHPTGVFDPFYEACSSRS